MGAIAAWMYQKWAANVSESVFRVFGGDLDPIFRENHQNSRSQHLQSKLDKSYGSHFRSENQTLAELITKNKNSNQFGILVKVSSMSIFYGKITPRPFAPFQST